MVEESKEAAPVTTAAEKSAKSKKPKAAKQEGKKKDKKDKKNRKQKGEKGKKRKPKKQKPKKLTAKTADPFWLYESSVQDPPTDVKFIQRVFKKGRGRPAVSLREDFCGTAKLCASWVKKKPERTAVGLDLDAPTLAYGKEHHIEPLGDAAKRVQLLERNVLEPPKEPVDVVAAFNFSYCVFKTREEIVKYAKVVRESLTQDGAFFMDIHGGSECYVEITERTKHKGYTYVWEQCPLDAITGEGVRYIHFEFPDGTKLKRAFTYDWRIWTLPEIVDILRDAGYSQVDVYWEGADENGDGDGIFKKKTNAENEESWIAYVVGWR